MRYNLPKLLALDVGAKQIGAAVFESHRLVFYAIKSIKKPTKTETLKQTRNVLKRLIIEYDIQVIAVEKLVYPQQQRSFVKTVYEEIRSFANEKNIKLLELEPLFVRQTICKNKAATKRNTFETITRLYSELSKAFAAKRIWQKAYYAYLFNAIAVGLVSVKEIKGRNFFKISRKEFENEGVQKNPR